MSQSDKYGFEHKCCKERDKAHAQIAALREALESLIDDGPCRYDHSGYCQTHTNERDDEQCAMIFARAVLTDTDKAAAQYQRVPEGWKPMSPRMTEEMWGAWRNGRNRPGWNPQYSYRPMFDAAPSVGEELKRQSLPEGYKALKRLDRVIKFVEAYPAGDAKTFVNPDNGELISANDEVRAFASAILNGPATPQPGDGE